MDETEFYEYFVRYWRLTASDLSELTGIKRDTVYLWGNSRKPPTQVVRYLHLIHAVWLQWKSQEDYLPNVRLIYEQARDRQQLADLTEPEDEDT